MATRAFGRRLRERCRVGRAAPPRTRPHLLAVPFLLVVLGTAHGATAQMTVTQIASGDNLVPARQSGRAVRRVYVVRNEPRGRRHQRPR